MSNHGGSRKGAGRPSLPEHLEQVTVSVRLPKYLIDAMDEMVERFDGDMTRSTLIRGALISDLKIKTPN